MGKRAELQRTLRSETEIVMDRAKIARFLAMGQTEEEIAERMDLPLAAVRYDVTQLSRQWRANAAQDYASVKARELAKIDNLEREYWDAWENSKVRSQRKVETIDRGSGGGDDEEYGGRSGKWQKVTETTEPLVGDLGALRGVQWCIRERIKMYGLEAPKNVNVNQRHTWEVELKRHGIDANALFDQLVAEASRSLPSGEGGDDSGSDEAGIGATVEADFTVS
jgi:hypothetical protein